MTILCKAKSKEENPKPSPPPDPLRSREPTPRETREWRENEELYPNDRR